MLTYPQWLDPVAFSLGSFQVHWYGVMYLLGSLSAWSFYQFRVRKSKLYQGFYTQDNISDLVFYSLFSAIIGGRLGYVFFYGMAQWSGDLLWPFKIWEGGMSFHGGMLGAMAGAWLYSRKIKRNFWAICDFMVVGVCLALGFGRMGNFIGSELYGRVSDVPWAIVFPGSDGLHRHPSQLYQVFLEGVVLFFILVFYSQKPRRLMSTTAVFFIGYGFFRFLVEFAREPDAHLGFIAFSWLTMGQLLSLPMIAAGLLIIVLGHHQKWPMYPTFEMEKQTKSLNKRKKKTH